LASLADANGATRSGKAIREVTRVLFTVLMSFHLSHIGSG
jgi:hypothetical protein